MDKKLTGTGTVGIGTVPTLPTSVHVLFKFNISAAVLFNNLAFVSLLRNTVMSDQHWIRIFLKNWIRILKKLI